MGEHEDRGNHHGQPGELHEDVVGAVALQDVAHDFVAEACKADEAECREERRGDAEAHERSLREAPEGLVLQLRIVRRCVVVGGERAVEECDRLEDVKLEVVPVVLDGLDGTSLLGRSESLVEHIAAGQGRNAETQRRGELQAVQAPELREREDEEHRDQDDRILPFLAEDGAGEQTAEALLREVADQRDVAHATEEAVEEEHYIHDLLRPGAQGGTPDLAEGLRVGLLAAIADHQEPSR
mmetsp:Transcript_47300/g.124860  ORF Transcript_47300/g.124860 Transcript_47300/m.124860 type:complete len:240 (+) Transcript_47300:416-1135(+)